MGLVRRMDLLVVSGLLLAGGAVMADITDVSPDSAPQGATDLSVQFTLAAPPPLPPDQVNPQSVTIGAISAKSFERNGAVVAAVFDIPAGETPGAKTCTVQFDRPSYTAVNGFTVTFAGDSPPVITAQPVSRTVSPNATALGFQSICWKTARFYARPTGGTARSTSGAREGGSSGTTGTAT